MCREEFDIDIDTINFGRTPVAPPWLARGPRWRRGRTQTLLSHLPSFPIKAASPAQLKISIGMVGLCISPKQVLRRNAKRKERYTGPLIRNQRSDLA